jgi:hypothetical protein
MSQTNKVYKPILNDKKQKKVNIDIDHLPIPKPSNRMRRHSTVKQNEFNNNSDDVLEVEPAQESSVDSIKNHREEIQ